MWTLAQARSSLVSRGAQHVPTLENGAPGTAIVVHIHLTGLGVLVDQVRHAVAVKVGSPHYLPAACVEATTEAGPTNESGLPRARRNSPHSLDRSGCSGRPDPACRCRKSRQPPSPASW